MSIQDPDQELVERSKRGDAKAFADLVERYQRLLTSIAVGMLRDEAKAEDVVQDSFISAWKSLPRFQGRARFRNWLCRIAVNKARSALRWGRLWRWVSLESAPVDRGVLAEEALLDRSVDPERTSLAEERSRLIREAVAALPLQQRTAVLLRGSGLEVLEVAETMGVAEGTVKAHLHQARRRLEKTVGEG